MAQVYYVTGFLFSPDFTEVVLIKKNKPAWQKGKLNGVGGKIEPYEDSKTAMIREFYEETGLETNNWNYFCHITDECTFRCDFWWVTSEKYLNVKSTTDEEIFIHKVEDISKLDIIPNVAWLISMALSMGLAGEVYYIIKRNTK